MQNPGGSAYGVLHFARYASGRSRRTGPNSPECYLSIIGITVTGIGYLDDEAVGFRL